MSDVDAFALPGIKCWFHSNDHGPPHFHAKRSGQWECRVKFLLASDQMLERIKRPGLRGRMSAADRNALCAAAAANREALLEEFETKVRQVP